LGKQLAMAKRIVVASFVSLLALNFCMVAGAGQTDTDKSFYQATNP
jgi:hypothetical protein